MITLTREEAQQVLDAMIPYQQKVIATTKEYGVTVSVNNEIETAIETLRARLSAPEPEPVAWMHSLTGGGWQVVPEKKYPTDRPLYTAPPQRKWQGLTDEDYEELLKTKDWGVYLIEATEDKLKEKNL
jgi:hypothetical protein